MSFVTSIISLISPAWALKREMAARTLETIQKRRYDAAAYGRRTNNWYASSRSASSEIALSLWTLRNRSREMVRNNEWAGRAIQVISINTVGTGIRPAISIRAKNGKPKKGNSEREKQLTQREEKLKLLWNDWADSCKCDYDGRMNFYGLQKLVMRAVAESGECLIVKKVVNGELRIKILEGDYIDSNKHDGGLQVAGQGFNFYGVRYNAQGQREGVWVYPNHPEIGNDTSVFYTEENVIHVYEVLRAGQARGVPMGVATFLRMRDMKDYEDAQLLRQKVAACFTAFVHNSPDSLLDKDLNETSSDFEKLEPAMINYLAPGEQVTFAQPPTVEGIEPYIRVGLRAVAAGYNVPYETLTTDLSNVNFSSGRMGWLDFHRSITAWQRDIMNPALEKAFAWFMQITAITTGITDTVIAEWTAPKREMIDPVKETNGVIAQIQAGLKSYPEAVREAGYDPDDTMSEIKAWNDKIDEYKLVLSTDLRNKIIADNSADPTNG